MDWDKQKAIEEKEILIVELKEIFSFILKDERILGLLLFGSYASGDQTPQSDIDLCFVVPNKPQMLDVYSWIMKHAESFRDTYDIRFFEEFPLHIKIRIIEKGIPIVSKDTLGMYEYFWIYRQLWEDFQLTVANS